MGQPKSGTSYRIDTPAPRIRELPSRLRPREELERVGVQNVADDVLLAVLLRTGIPGKNVRAVATELLQRFGSLTALAGATEQEIVESVKGVGHVGAKVLMASLEVGRRLGEECVGDKCSVRSPQDVARLFRDRIRTHDTETFWVLLVDAKHRLKRIVEVTRGLLDASLVHPREVFREAIRAATAAVVVVHNHPSGDPAPSAEDLNITRQLVEAGRIVGIAVLDHVIVGRPGIANGREFVSLREEGVVEFG